MKRTKIKRTKMKRMMILRIERLALELASLTMQGKGVLLVVMRQAARLGGWPSCINSYKLFRLKHCIGSFVKWRWMCRLSKSQ
jgi:hypothetical protein